MPLNITSSVDLQVKELASNLLNNWLDEVNLDKIIDSKVEHETLDHESLSSTENESSSNQVTKKKLISQKTEAKKKLNKKDEKNGQKSNAIGNLGNVGKSPSTSKLNATRSKSPSTSKKSNTSNLNSTANTNQIKKNNLDNEYSVSNLINQNPLDEKELGLIEQMFIPNSATDLNMLEVLETNRQLKALSDFSNPNAFNSKFIWKSAQAGSNSSPTQHNPHTEEYSQDNDYLENQVVKRAIKKNLEDQPRPKSSKRSDNKTFVRLRASSIGKKMNLNSTHNINNNKQKPSQFVLTGKTLFDESPNSSFSNVGSYSPTASLSPTMKRMNHHKEKKDITRSKLLSSPTVLSRSLRQQAENDEKELIFKHKLNPSLYVNNEAAIQLNYNSSPRQSSSFRKSLAKDPNEMFLAPKPRTKTNFRKSVAKPEININRSSIDTIDDPEVYRIMNMKITDIPMDDESEVINDLDLEANQEPPENTPQPRDIPFNPIDIEAYLRKQAEDAQKAMKKEQEWEEKMKKIQEKQNQLATLEEEKIQINRNLFNVQNLVSDDNPYINSNVSKKEKAISPSAGKKYQRMEHPEIVRQKNVYKNLYSSDPQEADIENEIEKKLVSMHEELKRERDEKEKIAEMLKKIELERKKEELEKIRLEKQKLIEEQKKIVKHNLLEKAKSFSTTIDLRLKRKAFLFWKSLNTSMIKRLKEFEYKLLWKKKSKIFIAWKNYVKKQKEIKFEQILQRRLIVEQQREEAADNFYRMKLLTQSFIRMQFMFRLSKQKKEIIKVSKIRHEKMNNLLQRLQDSAQQQQLQDPISQSPITTKSNSRTSMNISQDHSNSQKSSPSRTNIELISKTSHLQSNQDQADKTIQSHQLLQSQDNSETQSQAKSTQSHPFLSMLERQKARMESRRALQEKYKKADEEKERQREEEQRKLEQEEKEQKRLAIQEKKKEKELKIQKEKEKEQRLAEYKKKKEIADLHYLKACMKYHGFLPWKRFIQQMHDQNKKSDEYYSNNLKRLAFHTILESYHNKKLHKEQEKKFGIELLVKSFNRVLLKQYFENLKQIFQSIQESNRRIDILYETNLKRYVFKEWLEKFRIQKTIREKKEAIQMDIAMKHSNHFTKKWFFIRWKMFVILSKEEKKEKHLESQLRNKVENWLSDFRVKTELDWDI